MVNPAPMKPCALLVFVPQAPRQGTLPPANIGEIHDIFGEAVHPNQNKPVDSRQAPMTMGGRRASGTAWPLFFFTALTYHG
jgi:hypothetical protein